MKVCQTSPHRSIHASPCAHKCLHTRVGHQCTRRLASPPSPHPGRQVRRPGHALGRIQGAVRDAPRVLPSLWLHGPRDRRRGRVDGARVRGAVPGGRAEFVGPTSPIHPWRKSLLPLHAHFAFYSGSNSPSRRSEVRPLPFAPAFIPQALLSDLERADLTGDALDEACDRIQALVKKLELPGKLTEQVRGDATRVSDRERYGHGSDGTDPRLCSCP